MAKHRAVRHQINITPTIRISAIIIDNAGKMLLVKHRKNSRQYWVLPGGRLEYGETFQVCIVRELKEETNLDIETEKMVFISEAIAPDKTRHIINLYFTAKVIGGKLQLGDEEVLAGVDYIKLADLTKLTLYPSITAQLIAGAKTNFAGSVQYLGNLWV